jgi:hypothetical protein
MDQRRAVLVAEPEGAVARVDRDALGVEAIGVARQLGDAVGGVRVLVAGGGLAGNALRGR